MAKSSHIPENSSIRQFAEALRNMFALLRVKQHDSRGAYGGGTILFVSEKSAKNTNGLSNPRHHLIRREAAANTAAEAPLQFT